MKRRLNAEPTKQRLNERQEQIVDMLIRDGEVKIAELSRLFDVTEMTIRRDLEKLERLQLLRRTIGGGIPAVSRDLPVWDRSVVLPEAKAAIGRAAAALIKPGEAVFFDAGTTTVQVARWIPKESDITVVTNALNVAAELLGKRVQTIVVGGLLREATSSLVGPLALEAIERMAFDRAFLGATGLTLEHGFSNSNVFEAELKRLVVAKAAEVNMLIDHSKFGVLSLASFAELPQVHRIITDRTPPESFVRACEDAGVELVAVENG
jgi:DeoR family transcriptional regulator of aga operon/DeoR family fructose operon transcriptional repressor